jgi:F0F1-type ATP synthase assembly protein I
VLPCRSIYLEVSREQAGVLMAQAFARHLGILRQSAHILMISLRRSSGAFSIPMCTVCFFLLWRWTYVPDKNLVQAIVAGHAIVYSLTLVAPSTNMWLPLEVSRELPAGFQVGVGVCGASSSALPQCMFFLLSAKHARMNGLKYR